MTTTQRRALITIAAALTLDVFLGSMFAVAQSIPLWLGLYCALANAVTVGGPVAPSTPWGYVTTAAECLLVVPLFAATFSLFTSGLTANHPALRDKMDRSIALSRHIIEHHPDIPNEDHNGRSLLADEGSAPVWVVLTLGGIAVLAIFAGLYWASVASVFLHLSGANDESGTWYGAWSGFGGAIPDFLILVSLATAYYHGNCHQRGCWRLGHKVDGIPYRVCHRHHPEHGRGSRNVSAETIAEAYRQHKENQST